MKNTYFPDTQENIPNVPVYLTKVGVTGVKKLLEIERNDKRPIILLPTFDAYVDLPNNKRGIHMSRNPEAINEVLDESLNDKTTHVEMLCANIAKSLLEKHEYAEKVEVNMNGEYVFLKKSPVTKRKTQEISKIMANAIGYRDKNKIYIRKMIGMEVTGMTVCPCAQESVKESSKQELLKFLDEEITQKVLDTVIFASHNQRGRGTIMIEVPEDQTVRGEDLIKIMEESMSSPVYELLKRPDENAIVTEAHKNPVFVEDCVRNMVKKIVKKFTELPDHAIVTIKQVNEESIHRHDAFAEKTTNMGELRLEVLEN